ncbi:acetaldehyde dehydrogenase, partial [Halorubrum sp. SS7]
MNEDRGGGGDEAEASARLDEAEPSGPDEAQPVESAGPTPDEADAPDDGAGPLPAAGGARRRLSG